MRLTQFTDYALRLLIYAATHGGRLVTIEEAAAAYGISRNHLMKVANHLTRQGYLKSVRGRSGGLTLARPAAEIGLGLVIRATEPDFAMVECFGGGQGCRIHSVCRLKGVLGRALAAFLAEMDRHNLAELAVDPAHFGFEPPAALPR
ncbi:MAG: BadM/Rrf2 family transcriptional regulator [Pelagibacterium sp. SCN 64-44]|nr:MAG: BadM/Rrf2 family transcriptional regulator [Pelagibacterium sp. SCN 64-44]